MSEQISFETSDFAGNPAQRCACVLLLDVSASMSGRPLDELNAGLATFRDDLSADTLAMKSVEIGVVTFGPAKVEVPFTSALTFDPPTLHAQGDTPMGAAITQALNMVEERKRVYRAHGISYFTSGLGYSSLPMAHPPINGKLLQTPSARGKPPKNLRFLPLV